MELTEANLEEMMLTSTLAADGLVIRQMVYGLEVEETLEVRVGHVAVFDMKRYSCAAALNTFTDGDGTQLLLYNVHDSDLDGAQDTLECLTFHMQEKCGDDYAVYISSETLASGGSYGYGVLAALFELPS
jgi:hypothetical protein